MKLAFTWLLLVCSIFLYAQSDVLDTAFANHGKFVHTGFSSIHFILPDNRIGFILSNTDAPDTLLLLHDDGSPDDSFAPNGMKALEDFPFPDIPDNDYTEKYINNAIALSDNKILVCGYAEYDIGSDAFIARYHDDATLDTTFGEHGIVWMYGEISGYEYVSNLFIDHNDRIVFLSTTNSFDFYFHAGRLNNDGGTDSTFATDGVYDVPDFYLGTKDIIEDEDGNLFFAGFSGEENIAAIMKFTPDGLPDAGFGTFGISTLPLNDSELQSIYFDPVNIVVSGKQFNIDENNLVLAKFYLNGDLNTSFGDGGYKIIPIDSVAPFIDFTPAASLISSEGEIYYTISHNKFAPADSVAAFAVLKYDQEGDPVISFSTDGSTTVFFNDYRVGNIDDILEDGVGKLLCTGVVGNYVLSDSIAAFRFFIDGTVTGTDTVFTAIDAVAVTNNSIALFPNPASNELFISLDNDISNLVSKYTLRITNLSGQIIYQSGINSVITPIDISDYAAGVYFVQMMNTDQIITQKFIKQ